VIRPSSKGNDHLAITWKVADGVYQHIDVLELQKDNEFSVGRQLRIGGKYNYSDLDELIVDHVKAMAKKVDELMQHEKYQSGSKADTGKNGAIFHLAVWLTILHREMVDHIHRSQPEALCLRVLPGSTTSWILLPLLQGWTTRQGQRMAGASSAQGFRAAEECLSRHESSV
jgi:hypothetical protein